MQNATNLQANPPEAVQVASPLPELTSALRDVVVELRRSGPGDQRDKAAVGLLAHLIRLGPTRAGDLADHACLTASTVSRHLKELEDAGYLVRTPDPEDRRATVLGVSPSGIALVDDTTAHRMEVLGRAVAKWSARDLATMTRLMRRLADDLETR